MWRICLAPTTAMAMSAAKYTAKTATSTGWKSITDRPLVGDAEVVGIAAGVRCLAAGVVWVGANGLCILYSAPIWGKWVVVGGAGPLSARPAMLNTVCLGLDRERTEG